MSSTRAGRSADVRSDALALAALAVVVALPFTPLLFGHRALFYFDITSLNLPFRHFFAEGLRAGELRLWSPELGSGFPLFAEGQGGALFPLNWIFYAWMEPWRAFSWTFVATLWLAAIGTYAFLRQHCSRLGAFAGAGLFALSGAVGSHHHHTALLSSLACMPAAFAAWERWLRTGHRRSWAAAALLLGFQHLAGSPPMAAMTALALVLYTALRAAEAGEPHSRAVQLAALLAALAAGAGAAAVQLLPTLELASLSPRSRALGAGLAGQSALPPSMGLLHVLPDAFGSADRGTLLQMPGVYRHEVFNFVGITGLLAAVCAWCHPRSRKVAAFAACLAVFGVLALGSRAVLFDVVHGWPPFDRFRVPGRYLLVFDFAFASLAALGIDALARPTGWRRWRVPAALLAAFLCLATVSYLGAELVSSQLGAGPEADDFRTGLARDLGLRAGLLIACGAAFALPAVRPHAAAVVAALLVGELALQAARQVPDVDAVYWEHEPPVLAALAERAPGRIASFDCPPGYLPDDWRVLDEPRLLGATDSLLRNLPAYYGVSSIEVFSPLRLASHDILRQATWRLGSERNMGARYRIECGSRRPPGGSAVAEIDGLRLVALRNPLPRAFVVHSVRRVPDVAAALGEVARAPHLDREAILLASDALPVELTGCPTRGIARVTRAGHHALELEVETACPGLLVVLDTVYPGWQATVDGEPTGLLRANGLYRGVALAPGSHRVTMSFESGSVRLGAAVSAASLALLVGLALAGGRWAFAAGGRS